jgi:hypothetical protein
MKRLAFRVLWWIIMRLLASHPRMFRACADLVMAVEGGLAPVAVLGKVLAAFIPGTADDALVQELMETPSRVWLRTRGSRIYLPTGRTIAESYAAIKREITGRED